MLSRCFFQGPKALDPNNGTTVPSSSHPATGECECMRRSWMGVALVTDNTTAFSLTPRNDAVYRDKAWKKTQVFGRSICSEDKKLLKHRWWGKSP